MPYALCPMPYALCPMPYALCPMPYALCPMPARAAHVTEKGYSANSPSLFSGNTGGQLSWVILNSGTNITLTK